MRPIFRSLFVVLLSGLVSMPSAFAEEKTDKTQSQLTAKKKKSKKSEKNKLGVDQSDFMPPANRFGLIANYGFSYNQLQQVEVKTTRHILSLAGTYGFDKHWSAYSSVGVLHETFGGQIVRDTPSEPFHQFTNLNFGVVYSKMKPLSFVNRSSNTFNISLPTSELSRFDKHIGSLSLTNFMSSYSWNKMILFNRMMAHFQWNSQKYSITTDLINRDWLLANSFGITYVPWSFLGLRTSFNVSAERYLDNQWTTVMGNNITAFANVQGFQLYLSYLNQSYPENDSIDPVMFDRYRRLISGGVTYSF